MPAERLAEIYELVRDGKSPALVTELLVHITYQQQEIKKAQVTLDGCGIPLALAAVESLVGQRHDLAGELFRLKQALAGPPWHQ